MRVLYGLILLSMLVGCREPFYMRTVVGKVVSEGSRFAGKGMADQKIAVLLKPYEASDSVSGIAGGDGSLAIECVSTRCAVLQPGMCVEFSCKTDHRVFEPSVVECKMDQILMNACDWNALKAKMD